MRLLDRLRPNDGGARSSWLNPGWFSYQGVGYPLMGGGQLTLSESGRTVSLPEATLPAYASALLKGSSPVFALIAIRQLVFSSVEFAWQRRSTGDVFGDTRLRPLEEPWPGGTTQNLLAKVIVDADLAGNSYWLRDGDELVQLRPDRVRVALEKRDNGTFRKVGFIYRPGDNSDTEHVYTADEVVHFMPLQDPVAPWRGMSWVTPVLREWAIDQAATDHQKSFLENAATPNIAVKVDPNVTPEQFRKLRKMIDESHGGPDKAGRTMYLGGGQDVTVVGANLQELDLRVVQGGLETRMAAAAGVPVSIVGFREGNQGSALNASTYQHARRRFADGTMHPLWREAAGSFAKVVSPRAGDGVRLWFRTDNVPFLREDAKDAAEIMRVQIGSVRQGIDAGFDPDAVVAAVNNDDLKTLTGKHTGLTSVQLVPPGSADSDQQNAVTVPNSAAKQLLEAGWRHYQPNGERVAA